MYTEVDLGDTGKNPVALHEVNGAVLSVNNGDWSSTSVSRVVAGETLEASTEVLTDVAAGCNASAVVSANRLALQIDQEAGLRLVDGATGLGTGEILNPDATSAYSLAIHPTSDMTFSGVTDFVTEGHVDIHDDLGNLIGSVQVGIAPGTLGLGRSGHRQRERAPRRGKARRHLRPSRTFGGTPPSHSWPSVAPRGLTRHGHQRGGGAHGLSS